MCRQGFSLVFYGFGSKRSLLDKFMDDACTDGGRLAVNGMKPQLTAKKIVARAAAMIKHADAACYRCVARQQVLENQPSLENPR